MESVLVELREIATLVLAKDWMSQRLFELTQKQRQYLEKGERVPRDLVDATARLVLQINKSQAAVDSRIKGFCDRIGLIPPSL